MRKLLSNGFSIAYANASATANRRVDPEKK
jgi:hypothetical protein